MEPKSRLEFLEIGDWPAVYNAGGPTFPQSVDSIQKYSLKANIIHPAISEWVNRSRVDPEVYAVYRAMVLREGRGSQLFP